MFFWRVNNFDLAWNSLLAHFSITVDYDAVIKDLIQMEVL